MVVLACFSYLSASAYDFETDGLYFTITSAKDLTVSVDGAVNKDTDKIVIPQTVVYKGRTLTVTSVGDNAFSGSAFSDLQSVTLPNTILSIGEYAFSWTSIKDIRFPSSLTSIGNSAFSHTKLCSIALPDNIEDIPSSCFFCCDSLKSIQWPKRLRSIGYGAFEGCRALTNFTIPPSVVGISPSIIRGCSNISKLTIGKGLNGLPFTSSYDLRWAQSLETDYIQGFTSYFSSKLDTVIIEDAHDEFSIKGYISNYGCHDADDYRIYPAFSVELDYFYVGRPLIDISRWTYSSRYFDVDIKAPAGNIKKLEIAGTCTENPLFYQSVDTLILGKNIESFYVDRLYGNCLDMIICKSTTPPVVCNGPFLNKVYTDVTLYVPKGCKDAYSKDSEWGIFWDIQEFEDDCNTEVTNVTNVIDTPKDISITTQNGSIIVSNAPHNTLVQVYDLQGALVAKSQRSVISGLSKGAYLVNVGGKTFKVVL